MLRKIPPEEIKYIRLVWFPCVYFKYEYFIERGLIRKEKIIRRSSTVYDLFLPHPTWTLKDIPYESREIINQFFPNMLEQIDNILTMGHFRPELVKYVEKNRLISIDEGYYLPPNHEPEERVGYILDVITTISTKLIEGKDRSPYIKAFYDGFYKGFEKLMRYALNFDGELSNIQDYTEITLFFIPYWFVKLETPKSYRYLIYDHNGGYSQHLTDKFTKDKDLRLKIKNYAKKIS